MTARGWSCSGSWRSPPSVHFDAPRLRRLLPRDAHVQDAVAVASAHLAWVEVVGEGDDAVKAPGEALVHVHARALVLLRQALRALARDAEHAALDLHLDRLGLKAGREGVDLGGLRGGGDVQRRVGAAREAADAGRELEGLLHLALQPLELGVEIAREKREIHGHTASSGWLVGCCRR